MYRCLSHDVSRLSTHQHIHHHLNKCIQSDLKVCHFSNCKYIRHRLTKPLFHILNCYISNTHSIWNHLHRNIRHNHYIHHLQIHQHNYLHRAILTYLSHCTYLLYNYRNKGCLWGNSPFCVSKTILSNITVR